MVDREGASVKIVDIPCISIARLLDLRAFIDSGLAFHSGEQIPKGGFDGESVDKNAAGFVRRAPDGPEAWSNRAGEGAEAGSVAVDGGDGEDGRPVGDGQ